MTPPDASSATAPDADAGVLLIVDDEPEIRDILGFLAARCVEGLTVRTAADAHQAQEIIRTSDVRAVLTDLRMPGQSGLDLIRSIRAHGGATRCALMTGYQEDIVDGVSLAALDLAALLRKPFGSEEAYRTLSAISRAPP